MPTTRNLIRLIAGAILAAVGALALAGGAATAQGTLPVVTVSATKSKVTVTGADDLTAGPTRFVVSGATASKDVIFVALKPGVTASAFETAAAKLHGPPTALETKGTFVYQPSVGKGVKSDTSVDLGAGDYAVLDISRSAKLVTSFTVAAASGTPNLLPKAAASITLKDYRIQSPATIAGDATVKVHNAGPSPHFLVAVPVKDAATAKKAEALLKAGQDKKAESLVGGPGQDVVGLISPKIDNTVALPKLKAGTYVLACFYSDARSKGKEHSKLGMEHTITIR